MSLIATLPTQKKLPATPAIYESLEFKAPIYMNDAKIYQVYDVGAKKAAALGAGLARVLSRHYHTALIPPDLPPVPATDLDGNAIFSRMCEEFYQYSEKLVDKAQTAGLGKIEWHTDDRCVFDYPEAQLKSGWTKKTITRSVHTHDLVKARQHRLPATDIKRPPFVDEIIADLPRFVHPHLRIVTGLEVAKSTGNVRTEESLTELGQLLHDTRLQMAAITATALAAGIAAGAVLASAAAAAAIPVAIADPCLCLGSLVLAGWENQ